MSRVSTPPPNAIDSRLFRCFFWRLLKSFPAGFERLSRQMKPPLRGRLAATKSSTKHLLIGPCSLATKGPELYRSKTAANDYLRYLPVFEFGTQRLESTRTTLFVRQALSNSYGAVASPFAPQKRTDHGSSHPRRDSQPSFPQITGNSFAGPPSPGLPQLIIHVTLQCVSFVFCRKFTAAWSAKN